MEEQLSGGLGVTWDPLVPDVCIHSFNIYVLKSYSLQGSPLLGTGETSPNTTVKNLCYLRACILAGGGKQYTSK